MAGSKRGRDGEERECEQKYDSINGGAFRAKCQTPTPNCHLIGMAAQQYPQMPYRNHFYLFFIFTFRSACLRDTEVAELSAFIHIRSIQYFCRNFEIPPQFQSRDLSSDVAILPKRGHARTFGMNLITSTTHIVPYNTSE